MTINEYIQAVNDPGRKYGLLGPIGPVVVYRVEAPARPSPSPSRRPASPPPPRRVWASAAGDWPAGGPRRCCICNVAIFSWGPPKRAADTRCARCHAEVTWLADLGRRGFRVVG